MPIISSLLETDLYKLTMAQCVLHQFPSANVEYEFKSRTDADLRPLIPLLNDEIDSLCTLQFTKPELDYLRTLRFLKSDFIDFLGLFKLNRDYIKVGEDSGRLTIDIKGPMIYAMWFEIYILSIVNQLHFSKYSLSNSYTEGAKRLEEKIKLIKDCGEDFKFMDFGLRRRFSGPWQEYVIETLKHDVPKNFIGTSNLAMAKKYNLVARGTMAHEHLQACQAFVRLKDFQKYAFKLWSDEYRGDLGIALSDIVGMDAFLKDFDLYFSKLFDGARHDSGDPYVWCNKLINHYKSMGIDPKTKIAVFSDSLDFPKALAIWREFKDQIKISFGIGTNLMNDMGVEPLNIVIKMTVCNGQPVAKLSDSPGKTMCKDESYVTYLKSVFNI